MIGSRIGIYSQITFEPEYQAIIDRAVSQGYTLPSFACQVLQNALVKAMKAATTNGTLSAYADINIYINDVDHAGSVPTNLGFDGIKWNSPTATQSNRVNTITKTVKNGYSSNGTNSYINRNYIPTNESITDNTDHMSIWGVLNLTHGGSLSGFGTSDGVNRRIQCLFSSTAIQSGVYSQASFISTSYTGRKIFCVERKPAITPNPATALTFVDNTQIMSQTVLSVAEISWTLYDLAQASSTGVAGEFLNAATVQTFSISGKATEIDRTALHAALNTYINGVLAL